MRLPDWIPSGRAVTATLVSLAVVGCLVPGATRALEVAAAVAVGRLLLRDAAVRRVIASLGRARTAAVAILFGAFAFFHLVGIRGEGLKTYPFVEWSMYTRPSSRSTFMRFVATHASGRRAHYPFEDLYGRSPRSMMRRFEPAARMALGESGPDRAEAARRGLEDDLQRLAELHDRRHPADPIVALDAEHCMIVTAEYRGRESVATRLAARIETRGSQDHATR